MVASILVMKLRDDKYGDKQLLSFRIESNREILPSIVKERQEGPLGMHPKNTHTLQPFQLMRLPRGSRRG